MKSHRPTSRRVFLGDLSRGALACSGLAANGIGLAALSRVAFGQESLAPSPTTIPQNAKTDGSPTVASGKRGVVATVHPLASQAAIEAFERGGNAIDAAVAASLMLSVVDGHNSGLGGGCLALVHHADGRVSAFDGRETAPAGATPGMFFEGGQPAQQRSQLGPLAAGVPGLLATLAQLAQQYGAIPWNAALQGAAQIAEQGFVLNEHYARVLAGAAEALRGFPDSARVLLNPAGEPWPDGHTLVQSDLAQTLRSLDSQGVEWFYQGEFAARCEQLMRHTGGVLAAKDFASYRALQRAPIQTTYRQASVVGFPPPSSGGIHIAQMLGMLSGFNVREIFEQSAARGLHLLLEVMKRAMADRAYWLGDADFTNVPRGLLDPDYLKERASSIDLQRTTAVSSHGQPPRADVDLFGKQKHTTHLTTADAQGNVVAITQTVNTSFGCKMIVPGTGVVLNNEMDDFSIAPGVRNAFGLVGSAANVIAPGKRPLSSMSPTLVLDDDRRPILSCGAAGGPKIITTVLQILVRVLDLEQTIDQAIAAPRVHHQWSPDQAVCERALDDSVVAELEALGHHTSRIASAAVAQGIQCAAPKLTAATDPRVHSSARAL